MPVTLPPISRRGFIKAGAALGAGALMPALTWADEAAGGIDPHFVALFSDTHIDQSPDETNGPVNLTDNLAAAIDRVLARETRPSHTMICGDCAYLTGDAGDYAQLAEVLEPLRVAEVPVHCVLGNHDHRERFYEGIIQKSPDNPPVADRHVGVIEMERANWYLLDSLEVTDATPGILGDDQIDWLAQALDARPDTPGLVMLHHTFDLEAGEQTRYGVKDGGKLLAMLSEKPQAKAVFFGHSHHWQNHQRDDGLHMVNLPPTAYVFAADKPNGWVSCDLGDDGLTLTLDAHDTEHPQHGGAVELAYR